MTTSQDTLRTRWIAAPEPDPQSCVALQQQLRIHPIIARLMAQRGFTPGPEAQRFLEPKLSDLHDPGLLPGCDRAARRLLHAIEQHQPIVVYGDYDVDGITASAILYHMLTALGAKVTTYVPHRIDEGYGLNDEALTLFAQQEPRPLVVSVDCGITACAAAAHARSLGLELIITDHHEPGPERPAVDILVHPRIPEPGSDGSVYPFADLCGAGVAFKLAWHIARLYHGTERVSEASRALLMDLVSLAALGTIADVVPLVDENRIITAYGLGQIKRTRFVGLNALIEASRLSAEAIDAFHVGFVLAPRLNACGRMGHARDAVELLTDVTPARATEIACFLTTENDRRRRVERQIFDQAVQRIEEEGYHREAYRAIVIAQEQWHPGVIGIVASRLVERYARPVVMLNVENGEAHGSARSVLGISIHEALSQAAHLMTSFGGHAMAAGMRLPTEHVDELRSIVGDHINQRLGPDDLVHTVRIDLACTLDQLDQTLYEQLRHLAPHGRGNPGPRFAAYGVQLIQPAQRVGGEGRHLRLMLRQNGAVMNAIGFGMGDLADLLPGGSSVDLVFEPKLGTFQGRPQREMHLCDARPAQNMTSD